MSITQAATAALNTFPKVNVSTTQGPLFLPTVMVAIAGAESDWIASNRGDLGYDPQYGLCQGYSSWGLWMIHNVHYAYLESETGLTDPCSWAQWLSVPANNAQAALAVYQSQGLGAWMTYTQGEWVGFLERAKLAVAQAQGSPPTGSGAGSGSGTTPAVPFVPTSAGTPVLLYVGLGAAVCAGLLTTIAALEGWI